MITLRSSFTINVANQRIRDPFYATLTRVWKSMSILVAVCFGSLSFTDFFLLQVKVENINIPHSCCHTVIPRATK